jgi:hypothetical protein
MTSSLFGTNPWICKGLFSFLPAIAAAATTTAPMSSAIFPRRHRTGFGDGHIPATVFSSVEFLDCIRSFLIAGHLDKAEAFAAASIAIGNDLGGLNAPRLCEDFLQ